MRVSRIPKPSGRRASALERSIPERNLKPGRESASTDSVSLSSRGISPETPSAQSLSGALAAALPGPSGLATALLVRELDPQDYESWDQAERYYERVRTCQGDVESIAGNTPYSARQVKTIKDHLFYNTHQLDDGIARFDADPLIANAWSRLQEGTHVTKDLQLLEHELFEARFEALFDTDYRTAHDAANRSGRHSGLYV